MLKFKGIIDEIDDSNYENDLSSGQKMKKSDLDFLAEMDIKWLLKNGWTVKGNLAYRRLLEEEFSDISKERLEEIFIQYELDNNDAQKIISALQKIFELKQELRKRL